MDVVPAHFNMARYCIGQAAAATPDKTALLVYNTPDAREPVEDWGFGDIERAILQFVTGLHRTGLKRGDRIAIHLGNSSRSALLFFAAIAGGYVAMPLSDQLTPRDIRAVLDDSGAALIATEAKLDGETVPDGVILLDGAAVEELLWCPTTGKYTGSLAPYAETDANDPAFLIYTSGTTARPKGVLHAHRSAWGRRPMYQGWYGITQDDRMLHAGSFNWTYTLGVGLTDPWANGATSIVYAGDKRPEIWPGLIRATGATIFAAVPGIYRQILKYADPKPKDFGALRHGLVAGETPPLGLFDDWHAKTGRHLYEALGMSELSTYVSSSPTVPRRDGTIGKAQSGRRVAILPTDGGDTPLPPGQEGLIAVHRSDPGLMIGYWKRPDEEREVYRGEWFTGGDLGHMDADGYITHTGRANDLLNAGGYRVSPLEIEAVLAQAPGVSEVACAEIEVASGVRVIGAFIVKAAGATIEIADIERHAAEALASYKRPRQITFVDHLPRTANGKIKRSALTIREI